MAELAPLEALLAGSLGRPRLLAPLLSVFAAVGLLLSVIGVYGVVAYRVRQREREIGVRLALGAGPAGIVALVVRHGAGLALWGVALGVPAALALARAMQSVVFGIQPRDPLTFAVLPAVVLTSAIAARYLPARRAARIDPGLTMKSE